MFQPKEGERVAARMYCQGFGDCHLLAFANKDSDRPFYVLIDCGVVHGTSAATNRMREVAQSVFEDTGGQIDVLVVSHEHFDHVIGFSYAEDIWAKIKFGALWLAWTENPRDPLATKLNKYRKHAFAAVQQGLSRMALDNSSRERVTTMLQLLPAYSEGTGNALATICKICKDQGIEPQYLMPGTVLQIPGAQAIVLGPPYDETRIRHLEGEKGSGENFPAMVQALDTLTTQLGMSEPVGSYEEVLRQKLGLRNKAPKPFQESYQLTAQPPFARPPQSDRWVALERMHDPESGTVRTDLAYFDQENDWRRIDNEFMSAVEPLALQLDAFTNNISLALAFVLDPHTVLLYPADAQAGNWASWEDQDYALNGKTVNVKDLMCATRVYKVGHHCSHNGTFLKDRFELMPADLISFMPFEQVSQWPSIPNLPLFKAISEKGTVGRSDQAEAAPAKFEQGPVSSITSRPLYLQVGIA